MREGDGPLKNPKEIILYKKIIFAPEGGAHSSSLLQKSKYKMLQTLNAASERPLMLLYPQIDMV